MTDRHRLCHCGLHRIPIGASGIHWYWSMHTENVCYMDEADGMCWCGNMKSMHWNGHAPSAAPLDTNEQFDRAKKWGEEALQREKDRRGPHQNAVVNLQTRTGVEETES